MKDVTAKTKSNIPAPAQSSSAALLDKYIITEQKKEITRLQKLVAKLEVRLQSEVAKVKAQEHEKYRKKHLQITAATTPQEAARIYETTIKDDIAD